MTMTMAMVFLIGCCIGATAGLVASALCFASRWGGDFDAHKPHDIKNTGES